MKLEDRNIENTERETTDIEDYEMVPIEHMMYGCSQTNMNLSNPWMGMNQFNGMFREGFNPNGMMFGDESRVDYDEGNEDFSQMDKYQDRQPVQNQYNKHDPNYNDVDSIGRKMEQYNPAIFKRLNRGGIPYVEAKEIVNKIVKLTLMYRDE